MLRWLRKLPKLRLQMHGGVVRVVTYETTPRHYQELWFFAHEDHALMCGFRGGRHVSDPTMRCYTVTGGDVDSIRGAWLGKVVVTEYAQRYAYRHATDAQRARYERAIIEARSALRAQPQIWIEL